jgi:rhodanese-related sulfurtransferase
VKLAKQALFLALLLSLAMLVAACGGAADAPETGNAEESIAPSGSEEVGDEREVEGGTYDRISSEELESIKGVENVVLVNTHIPFEGDIPGTDLSIPYDEIGASLDRLPEDGDTKVVLYCMTGPMSTEAAEVLVERGYDNVLDGGMEAWQDSGLPLEGG